MRRGAPVTESAVLSYKSIRDFADRVVEAHNLFANGQRADIEGLVAKLGGTISYGDSNEALRVLKPGSFVINLPNMTSARRDRFTIAHELGHYFLHYLYEEKTSTEAYGRGERNLTETQANVFAASLFMPTQLFTAAHRELNGDAWALAARFDVSPAAAEVRSQVLALR